MAELTKQQLGVENTNSFPNNTTGYITPTILREFNTNMIDSLVDEISYTADSASFNARINNITGSGGNVDTGSLVTTSSFNAYTSSNDSKVNSLIAATGSYVTTSQTASMTVLSSSYATTASYALNSTTINTGSFVTTSSFNAYTSSQTTISASFDSRINAVTGSTPSGTVSSSAQIAGFGYATTGSNTFIGNQTISGSLFQSGSLIQDGITVLTGSVNISGSTTIKGTTRFENSSTTITGSLLISGSTTQIGNNTLTGTTILSGSVYVSGNIEVTNGANLVTHNVKAAGSNGLDILANNGATVASMGQGGGTQATFAGNISAAAISSSGNITGNLIGTASYATTALSSSYATTALSSSYAITASYAQNVQIIDTGSFATTGSNTFIGNEIISGSVIVTGSETIVGELFLKNPNQTLPFNNISSSGSNTNLIFGWSNPGGAVPEGAYTGSIVISGSNNILMQGKPLTIANGYYNYIYGNQNIIGSYGVLLSTGSVIRPLTSGNHIMQSGQIVANFTTSSIAGGAPSIAQNYVGGTGTANFQHQSSSLTFTGNTINGTFNSYASQSVATVRPSITNNIVVGTTNLLHQSSSVGIFAQNIINGTGINLITQFNNTGSANSVNLSRSNINGTNNSLFFSGTPSTNTSRSFLDVFIGGNNTTVTSSFEGSNNANLHASFIYGQNLVVSASHAANIGGTAFVGRYNDSGSLANTQNIVFGVGTGTSTANRKTGFYITSGSDSVFSGSLSVTGSFGATGNVTLGDVVTDTTTINGSTTINGNGEATIALQIISGSVEVVGPRGNGGHFYTNLPITSSEGRINGTFIVNDLIVSGAFGGNSSLNVLGNDSVTGSTTLGNLTISGSTTITGSVNGVVNPLSISSNTASLNLNNGNFFTLQLVGGTDTFINPSNIKPGQTINIRVNTTGSAIVSFPSSVKQPSGSNYIPTAVTGVDIVTLVSFDSSTLYLANVKNLI